MTILSSLLIDNPHLIGYDKVNNKNWILFIPV